MTTALTRMDTGEPNLRLAKKQALPPLAVSVQTIELTSQSIGNTYIGTITPYIQTSLAPSASGKLAQLNVRVGQTVTAGQSLASLDNAQYVPQQNAAEQASASLVSAQQQYADAQALYNDNLSAEQQVSSAQNALTQQTAALKNAQLGLQKAQLAQKQTMDGTATTQAEQDALQQNVTANQQALTSAQQQLTISQSNLTISKQNLDDAKAEYGSITQTEVQQGYQKYSSALSLYQHWQESGYVGQNPYQANMDATNAVYTSLKQGYDTLQQDQQQHNQGVQAVAQAQAGISQAEANLANAQKGVADAVPPASDSVTAQQADLAVQEAQAALAQAQAQYKAAVASLDLSKKIAADKTQAKQTLDNAANALRQDQVQADTAQRSLQVQIKDGQVVSPISGVVQSVGAQVGQQVGPQTTLITIASTNPTMATIDVPESDIGKMHKNDNVNITVPSLNQTFQGKVFAIHPQLTTATNQYPVDVVLNGSHSGLLPGLQVQGQLTNNAAKKVILVPADAVLSLQSGAEEVFVEQNGVVHSRIVQVGAMSSTQYEITDGLKVGDQIVVQGQNLLSDGDKVKVVSKDGSKGGSN
ncbi:efflux RND transporter periplasmic adaptor subunit [Alicyclobacillus dauci]|uniref:Efflux RND transporter periplasmic adaptor subunit n=1 Tax=Alicyclobacillus dauci TaxID=1475485 RepID=A0ABY6Z251_9BACL|nr:efflux RND transporter periplasmic adaptor subunit [Alicyclobacillus dauci]WAH36819.1 efflux RND transporter periplasmic adaptor subunit [Alicyclobacillus dauci]